MALARSVSAFARGARAAVPAGRLAAPAALRPARAFSRYTDTVTNLTETQEELRDSIYRFTVEELGPYAQEIDKNNGFDGLRDFWKKLGDMGLLGITAPGASLGRSLSCHPRAGGRTIATFDHVGGCDW